MQKAQGKFNEVQHIRPHAPAFRYTTPKLIEYERESIARVLAGKDKLAPIAQESAAHLQSLLPAALNDDQKRLIAATLLTRDQVFGIRGRAGTGKTTALRAIRELAEQQGFKTHGLGPTSRASRA